MNSIKQTPMNSIKLGACQSRTRIGYILSHEECTGEVVCVKGWARSIRKQGGGLCFVVLSDGSSTKHLQVVVNDSMEHFADLLKCNTGACLAFRGVVVASPAQGQTTELNVSDPSVHKIEILGKSDSKYPLAKKGHSVEYLRTIAHLRPRTNIMGCVMRVRNQLTMAVHEFFQSKGCIHLATPIITTSDCEGVGEMFQVSTIFKETIADIPKTKCTKKVDTAQDFFSKPAFLTVSGQLAAENYCMGMSDTYVFGPAFRAENSHTSRHLAEFWMIEPEIAFAEIMDIIELGIDMVKACFKRVLDTCPDELEFCEKQNEEGLVARLQAIVDSTFAVVTYTEAVKQLETVAAEKPNLFQVQPYWGLDLGSEHEKYLVDHIYKCPVVVRDYPKDFKAFYMRSNDDGKTVAAFDMLLPKVGELIGGSQREERLDKLEEKLKEKGLPKEPYWWYLDLRRYGTAPHSGFGLGFERLVMVATGIENIREAIPYPRYPGSAEF